MRLGKAAILLAGALALGPALAAPVVQATLSMGNNTAGIGIDISTHKAFVSNYNDGTLSVVDLATLTVIGTVPVGTHPRRLVVNSATNRVYVVNDNAPGTVTVVETGAYGIVATIPVGDNPRTLDADFGARQLFVANHTGNSVSIIDTLTNLVVTTVPVGSGPRSPTVNAAIDKVYVPNFNDGTVSVIDTLTRTVIKTITVGNGPQYGAVDGLHDKVYVNNVTDRTISVIDSATDSVIKTLPSGVGTDDNFGHVNHVYGRYYLPNATDKTLTIVDTDTDTVAATPAVGTNPIQVVTDANGGNVYVVNQGSNSVSILDASSETVLGSFGAGIGPWRMLVDDDHLYVLGYNAASPDTLKISTKQNTIADTHVAVEWYHEAFDHYFHTASALENQVIADGAYADDWFRTFGFFRVWTAPGPGRLPVSRFFSTQWGTKSSHFYTASQTERDLLIAGVITGWQLEADGVYYIGLADFTTGACPAGTVPLYRMFNDMLGGAPNHRFTGSASARNQMVAQGWVAEGSGPDDVYGCTPPL
jgi:YVTN family beta-propeller protein